MDIYLSYCMWSGFFSDLKRHMLEEHPVTLLTNNVLIVKREHFRMRRGYLLRDQGGNPYYLNVCYHIDKMLYFKVFSMVDECEKRKYRIRVTGWSFEGEIGAELGKYTRIPLKNIFQSLLEVEDRLEIAFEFVSA